MHDQVRMVVMALFKPIIMNMLHMHAVALSKPEPKLKDKI